MNQESYTLSKLYTDRIPILGKPRDVVTLKRIVSEAKVKPVGQSRKNAPLYRIEDIEAAFKVHFKGGNFASGDDEMLDLGKELKKQTLLNLKKKNELATKELEKLELTIEQLKSKLVDYEEAYKYLVARKAIHTALLRRILITDIPMTVCGMEFSEARAVCEGFYNEIIHSLIETSNLWRRKYAVGNDAEFEREIEKEIGDIINGKSKANTEASN